MFGDPRFAWLGVRYARLIVPWDAAEHPAEVAFATAWLQQARAGDVEPLVAFNLSVAHPRLLPTVHAYARAVGAFMRRFPWVTRYQTWDEENQASEPTSRDPRRAAQLFNWLSAACPRCAVTAADLLDGPSMRSWLARFLAHAHAPRLWGLHPYYELNYGGREGLSTLAHMAHGEIWLTEVGLPVWRFVRADHQFRFTDAAAQVRAARRLLMLSRSTRRVSRIYYYQWRSRIPLRASLAQLRHHRHVAATWDSGLLNPDCSMRPAFAIISRALGRAPASAPGARPVDHGMACASARAPGGVPPAAA